MAPEATPVNPSPTSHQNEASKQQNLVVPQESKSARKKRLQREKQASSDITMTTSPNASGDFNNATVANGDASAAAAAAATLPVQEPAVLKELQKQLRNITKKLNGMAKLDATVAENPEKSLDQLVEEKLINLDQKAQALKKPSLQASAAQIEEQIAQFKSYAAYYEALLKKQKSDSDNAHKEELEAVRVEVEKATTEKCEKDFSARLLTLSQFLCAAARMRQAGESTSNESRAFEGVLLQVYSGADDAVKSMMKLINGVEENVLSVEGDEVNVTYVASEYNADDDDDDDDEKLQTSASAEAAPVPQVSAEVQQEATVTETEVDNAPVSAVAEQTTATEEVTALAPADAATKTSDAAETVTVTATAAEEIAVAAETLPSGDTPAEATPGENTSVEIVAKENVTTEVNATAPAESSDNATSIPTPSQPRAHNSRGRGNYRGNRGGFYRGGRGAGNFRGGERGGRSRGGFRGWTR
ncbi:hypothetical protein KEM54_002953 [Ascosphaera aggregata]|nr:hypothetical protein KEM54_002953 [Ascosphaera aggregata]